MTHQIAITQDDIDYGKKKACFECPVSMGMSRHFKREVRVDAARFEVYNERGSDMFANGKLPQSAIAFIAAFDAGEKVEPFSFEVTI